MKIQLLRHATLLVDIHGIRFLVDPMLCEQGAYPPVMNSTNSRQNPLVSIPVSPQLLQTIQAVLVTHTHFDHWDEEAVRLLDKQLPVFCQPADTDKIKQAGFNHVRSIENELEWRGIRLSRTGGQHGTGEIGKRMGAVSGFVLHAQDEPVLYIAGDTIYVPEVENALDRYSPDVTIVNGGAAQFAQGDPITMTHEDIARVCRYAPETCVVAVHMEAINHCLETRGQVRDYLSAEQLQHQVRIPEDGEWLDFSSEAPC
ncbi:MBL fold metallo-hydrolase [Paenibacillus sp. UNC451MF]|uniref:MBL fold metallo-hydrolase n=1 Tax=Paenibacillus sp. UNC451MF TaxID=1449063 RepID=UPI00048EC0AC|nr:MBL fold metallo-hydrolase [Paenibacillus sp. UNC451MF]